MCDSSAFLLLENKETLLLAHVDFFEAFDGEIKIVNIFGEEKRVKAKIKGLSLLEHKLYFEPT